MKNISHKIIAAFIIAIVLFLQLSCRKDGCSKLETYTYYQPLYKSAAEARAGIKSNAPKPVVNPGKIYLKGNYIFLNEVNKGIHVIDNTNPAAPVNASFINIPGNVDIAVKGNIMYADFYTHLVVMDISNPLNITVAKFVTHVFPERNYYGFNSDTSKVIYDWVKKTETFMADCNGNPVFFDGGGMMYNTMDAGLSGSSASGSPIGISGSLARFALVNNFMYSVSYDSLKVFNITAAQNPNVINTIALGWGIETIYPFRDKLFIGSNTGMYIYSLINPAVPAKLGEFNHVRTCDPVIAEDDYAYVTLHSGTLCQGFTNQLDVLNIQNIQSPVLIKSYPFNSPRGLSKDGMLLFICDGNEGLKILNASNPHSITSIKQFILPQANDVIAFNNIALVIAGDGLYQFDYTNVADIKLISKIAVQQ